MSEENYKRENKKRNIEKKKHEKYDFWYLNKRKRNKISPKIKDKVNKRIKQLFQNLISHQLAKKFYYTKVNNNNSNINLSRVEENIIKGKYQSIFNFIKDLRNVLDNFFKIYAAYPSEFEEVFDFSDFCEKNINTFLNENNVKELNTIKEEINSISAKNKFRYVVPDVHFSILNNKKIALLFFISFFLGFYLTK